MKTKPTILSDAADGPTQLRTCLRHSTLPFGPVNWMANLVTTLGRI